MPAEAFFLPVAQGYRFCMYHPSNDSVHATARGQVVYVHPFADEMNKSRRMAALQARALSAAGFDVLQIDLHGCGDSSGDFSDATWDSWVADIVVACDWLRTRTSPSQAPSLRPGLWLWGLRAGCLLAVQAAPMLREPCHFMFWAPSHSGKLLLQQLLRLKAAADLASGNAKSVMEGLRTDLARGRPVEVAGYMVSPTMATGLEQASLAPPAVCAPNTRVEWLELSTRDDANLTPISAKAVTEWERAGYTIHSHLVTGPSFWQTTEIEDAPALIHATTSALVGADSP